jgi:hypothetical protein
MKLTRNFPLSEFTISRTARKYGIDNSVPAKLMDNVAFLAVCAQTLRDDMSKHFGKDVPVSISSGYRTPRLNRKLGGSKTSAHKDALAIDFTSPKVSVDDMYQFIYDNREKYPFIDQCIYEYGEWIHLGVRRAEAEPRHEFLTAFWNSHSKTAYEVYES